jgi:RNA polymerase-binding transcription factor DksA
MKTAARANSVAIARPRIPKRWRWHYDTLTQLRDRLTDACAGALGVAAQPIEPHSMHDADSATDEFDRELALSQLTTEQDSIYEVEAALKRIEDGSYGVCEASGKPIPAARLKAIPWTRFRSDVKAQLERSGSIPLPHLGPLGSVHDEPAAALAEARADLDEIPPPEEPIEKPL